MKFYFKNHLKLFILTFSVSLIIVNCEKDENPIIQENIGDKSVTEISFDDLQNKIGRNNTFSKTITTFKNKNKSSISNKSKTTTDNFEVGTDLVMMVENQNYVHYTLKLLKTDDQPTNEFYNLIFIQDKATDNISSKIIKYIPTAKWLLDTNLPYSGYVELVQNFLFTLDDLTDKGIQSKGSNGSCITDISGGWICEKNNNHSPADCKTEANPNGKCHACGAKYVVKVEYGQCPKTEFDLNEPTGGVTVDLEEETDPNTPGGDVGETNGSNNTETIILTPCKGDAETDINGNCIKVSNEKEISNCKETSNEEINAYYTTTSPFNVDLSDITNCDNIDTSNVEENQKFMCIYNKLTQSPKFKNLFIDTFGESKNLNVAFKVSDTISDNGRCVPGTLITNPINGQILSANIEILINEDILKFNSAISVAKTILHESIHAYLMVKQYGCNQSTPFENMGDEELGELLNEYFLECAHLQGQHEFMFNFMIPTMSGILADIKDDLIPFHHQTQAEDEFFINEDNPAAYPDGSYKQDTPWSWNEFYKYLSMAGLHNSSAFHLEILPENSPAYENYIRYSDEYGKRAFEKNCLD